MRSATEIVEAVVRELLPSTDGSIGLEDIERRRREFDAVVLQAPRRSTERAIAQACSEQLDRLSSTMRMQAFSL